ncbi:MAG: ChaN family lipoprotein [Burkholderiales bacterium]
MAPSLLITALTGCLLLSACAQLPEQRADLQRLSAALRSRPIVLLGEVHDNVAQHALRAQALRALLDSGARPALLMEQFDRERQADIDRALARPGVGPDDVIAAAAPDNAPMQGWSWPLYRPYLVLAIEYRLPVVAANVSRADTRRVLANGLPALGFDAAVPPDIAAAQAQAIADGHCGMLDDAQAGKMTGAQVARDQFMARAIEANAARGVVLLAGNGHVRRDVGVPRWLNGETRKRSVSIGLLEPDDPNAAAFDIALTTPVQVRADPCAGMRVSPAPSA